MFDTIKRVNSVKAENITVSRVVSATFRRLARIPHRIYYYWPWGFPKHNREKLKMLNDIYQNKRCFVIANGPSLKNIDFSLLKDEFTIGMNRIYLMKDQNGFMPNYLMCIDDKRLIKPFHNDLDSLEIPCFYPFYLRKFFSKKSSQYFIDVSFNPCFHKDTTLPFGNGNTVMYDTIQLAFCMGFSEIYLIGKDHNFNTKGKAGKGIEIKGDDENHFIKNYFLPGQKWDIPDFEIEEYAYKIAKKTIEADGRRIANATIGGNLEIFERVDFYSLFKN